MAVDVVFVARVFVSLQFGSTKPRFLVLARDCASCQKTVPEELD
jgi:hypothetical protein